MLVDDDALTAPKSSPEAVKVVGALKAPTLSDPVGIEIPPTEIPPDGKLSRTTDGMRNFPSAIKAWQWKLAPTGVMVVPTRVKLLPSMLT